MWIARLLCVVTVASAMPANENNGSMSLRLTFILSTCSLSDVSDANAASSTLLNVQKDLRTTKVFALNGFIHIFQISSIPLRYKY